MYKRRLIALLLCLLFALAAVLSACGTSSEESDTSSEELSQTSQPVSDSKYIDANGKYWPVYSDGIKDQIIGDRTEVRVLVYDNTIQTTYYSEEIEPDMYSTTDSTLNEAVRERNNYVLQQLGIEIKAVPVEDVEATVKTELTAGTGDFDIAMPFLGACASLAQTNSFYDLKQFEEKGIIDLSAPWYEQNANDTFSIQNRLYFTVSDMTIMHKIVSSAILYNPEMIESKYPDLDIFQMVVDGDWTLDEMIRIGKEFAEDSDGNGVHDYNDNRGHDTYNNSVSGFYLASGEKLCTKNEEDVPIIAINGERSVTVSQKVLDTLQDGTWVLHANSLTGVGDIWTTALSVFGDGRSAFYTTAFSAIKKLRAYDIDYRIVPYPKIDDLQEEYITPGGGQYAYGVVILNTLSEEDADFAAYMIDVLSAGGKQYIATAYYDQILKHKDALSDEDKSVDMLDLIFDTRGVDIGSVFKIGNYDSVLPNLATAAPGTFRSAYEAAEVAAQTRIDQLNELFQKLK